MTLSRLPPMIAGVAKALAARAKTITLPARIPGIASGTMTLRTTVSWPAPSDTAARSTAGSIFCNEAQTEITTNGTSTCDQRESRHRWWST